MRIYIIWILGFVLMGSYTFSQEYNFQYINQNKGLSNNFVNGILQDDRGYLFICTSEGLGVYDGNKVSMYYQKDKLVDDFISASYKDKKGNLWFGHNQGGSSIYYEGKLAHVYIGAGIGSQINDIAEDSKGRIWFVAQDYGLYFFDENNDKGFFENPSSNRLYYSLYISEQDHYLLGTDKGIEVYDFSKDSDGNHLNKVQNIGLNEENQIVSFVNLNGKDLLAFSRTGKVYKIISENGIYKSEELKYYNLNKDIIITNVTSAKGYLWISTLQDGVLKTQIQENQLFITEKYNKSSGLKTDAINTTYVDREGVLWIGTFGEGLAAKEDDIFTYYFINKKENNPITAIRVNKTNLYTASKGKIEHYDKQNVICYKTYTDQNGLPNDDITSMIFGPDSSLFIGTTLNSVYRKRKDSEKFEQIIFSEDILSRTISDLEISGNKLYIATLNGVYRYDIYSGGVNVFNITIGLPHNTIGALFKTSDDRIIIGTNSAFISEIINDEIFNYPIKDGLEVIEVNDIFEDKNGTVWFSSSGAGIFKMNKEGASYNIGTIDGLISNYCNAIRINNQGDIWVSHNDGLSKVSLSDTSVHIYDDYYGIQNRFLRSSIDNLDNEIWFGTENGIVLYNSDKDIKNKVSPITSLRYVTINDTIFESNEPIYLEYGTYKFGFGLAGLSLKGGEKIKYKFILEGYDDNWSSLTDKNSVYYTRMNDGEYTFRVKSYNADGTEGTEATIKIVVYEPYWKKWWFYAVCIVLFLSIGIGILKYRERSFIKYQEKLKRDLALRTREVVEQKNKIEAINKDITDSINYAQRIQGSILPREEYVKQLFPKSFIFFRPRDIVSGDFYWCGEVKGKQLMICADCTGHGVPGGFMSMISHILLREALNAETIDNPALILQQVNNNIVEVLKQTDDFESNRDGLDLAIVVIDKQKMELKFAGAMRPLFVYRNGVCNVIKGDRHSLGGINKDKSFETKFTDI